MPDLKFDQTESAMLLTLRENGIATQRELSEFLRHWSLTSPGAITKRSLRETVEAYLVHYAAEKSDNKLTLIDVTGKLRNLASEFRDHEEKSVYSRVNTGAVL